MTNSPARKSWNAGKLAVVSILLVAVGMAGFAWWWNWQRTQRCLEFFGGEGAHLIRTADRVEGLTLTGAYEIEPHERMVVGPDAFVMGGRKDLSRAAGLVHARTSLLDDASYEWDDPTAGDCEPLVVYAVTFREGDQAITLAFDFGCRQLWIVEAQRHVTLAPKIASGWDSFMKRHMPPDSPPANEK
jgi:hypothetical protein